MIKRTIEISRQPGHLSVRHDQLIIQPFDEPKEAARSIPAEDIGLLVVDQPQTTYSHGALRTLMKHGAAVVVCGTNHLPIGIMLPLSSNTEQVLRLDTQIRASRPLTKRLWQQVVVAKVLAQRRNLDTESAEYRRLGVMADEVKSGDSSNVEGQAAKVYWSVWKKRFPGFRRDPDGEDSINGMLNYGYAILRAALGRVLVAAGLHPALGLHHRHPANAFCLADDLLEPLRPAVDRRVAGLHLQGRTELDQAAKAHLLSLLSAPASCGEAQGPMMVQLHRVAASLVQCLSGERKKLEFCNLEETEEPWSISADIGACGS